MADDVARDELTKSRTSENALADAFVALAETLVDDYDVVELLDQLVMSCIDLLAVSAVGLLLNDQGGSLAVMASSSEETRLLEIFQLQNNEGPCLDCVHTGVPVQCRDLAGEEARWPVFVPAAIKAGFRSVVAVPMRLGDRTIGALNMFHEHVGRDKVGDQRIAQALADVATIGVLQQRSLHRTSVVAEQLQGALDSRIVIEQAKGVLAERQSVTVDEAFKALRSHARNHNLRLTDVATAVVAGSIAPSVLIQR